MAIVKISGASVRSTWLDQTPLKPQLAILAHRWMAGTCDPVFFGNGRGGVGCDGGHKILAVNWEGFALALEIYHFP